MTDNTNTETFEAIDLAPIARVIGFLGMFEAHISCAAGYEYGQERPATMEGEPDHLDLILKDEAPLLQFMGSGASDMLFIKDIVAAREAYKALMDAFGIAPADEMPEQNAPSTDQVQ